MYVKKDWNIQVGGDMDLLVQGNKTEQVMCGGTTEVSQKRLSRMVSKQLRLTASVTTSLVKSLMNISNQILQKTILQML